MPFSSAMPLSSRKSVTGATPMPTTARSASTRRPVLGGHRFEGPVAVKRFDLVPQNTLHIPFETYRAASSSLSCSTPNRVEEPAAEVEQRDLLADLTQ